MNAMPIEKLIKEDEKARYWQGGAQEVGEKLLELDQEWVALKAAASDHTTRKIHKDQEEQQ
jgi:hypothetical protein